MSCNSPNPPTFCSDSSPELKLYQAFIFSVPVFFTFILLLLFYLFYLRRRRANWASLRMRISYQAREEMPRVMEPGLKKEVREMLPVLVFKESFLIRETQCSVCLGEYKSDDRLKRIPPCGHTFHVECIDNWLAKNITCPLCRASLIPNPKISMDLIDPERAQNAIEGQVNEERQFQDVAQSLTGESSSIAHCLPASEMRDATYLYVSEECRGDVECRTVSEGYSRDAECRRDVECRTVSEGYSRDAECRHDVECRGDVECQTVGEGYIRDAECRHDVECRTESEERSRGVECRAVSEVYAHESV